MTIYKVYRLANNNIELYTKYFDSYLSAFKYLDKISWDYYRAVETIYEGILGPHDLWKKKEEGVFKMDEIEIEKGGV